MTCGGLGTWISSIYFPLVLIREVCSNDDDDEWGATCGACRKLCQWWVLDLLWYMLEMVRRLDMCVRDGSMAYMLKSLLQKPSTSNSTSAQVAVTRRLEFRGFKPLDQTSIKQ